MGPRRVRGRYRAAAPEGRLTRIAAGRSVIPDAPAGGPTLFSAPLHAARRSAGGRAGDVVLTLVVAGTGVGHELVGTDGHATATTLLLDLALSAPLLWRRSRPLAAFGVMAALAFTGWIFATAAGADVALLVALYCVGVHASSRRSVVAAAVVAQVGAVLAAVRWAPTGQLFTAVLLLTGTVTAAWALGVSVRTRRAYLTSLLERARTAERDRDRQVRLAAAQERARIARELHDIVAHSIAVMVVLSDGAAAIVERDPGAAREASGQASATGRQAMQEMHRLLGVLREGDGGELAPQPDLATIGELLEPLRSAGLAVDLVETGSPALLPASAQLAVYRLVQESLTNVLKHGRSVTHVTVSLRYGIDAVDIDVADDGEGSDMTPVLGGTTAGKTSDADTRQDEPPGHGLIGMRERLAAFGGRLEAERDGRGWRVRGHLPLCLVVDGGDRESAKVAHGEVTGRTAPE